MNWRRSDEETTGAGNRAGGRRGRAAEGQLYSAAERSGADPAGEAAAGNGHGPHGDHHLEPRSAAVLRPGTGADALVLGARGGAIVSAGGGARPRSAHAAV